MNQKTKEILSFSLKPSEEKLWINPVTGVLIYLQSNKVNIYSNIKLANQIPPDHIIDLSGKLISINFGQNFFYIGLNNGDIVQIDNVAYHATIIKKQAKTNINLIIPSPNEENLIIYLKKENKLGIVDLKKEKTKFYKIKYVVSNLLWLSSVKFIVASDDGIFHFWNIDKNKEYKTVEGHKGKITALSKHPRSYYTVLSGDENGQIKIWDFEEEKLYPDLTIAFTSNSQKIICITNSKSGDISYSVDEIGNIRLWDMRYLRKEREIIFISTEDSTISNIISSNKTGSFLLINTNGIVTLYEGFTIDAINKEFDDFQVEVENFLNKIGSIPSWILNNDLEIIMPNEIPILEKKIEITSKIFSTPIIEKLEIGWVRDNFLSHFQEIIEQEKEILKNIQEIQEKIEEKKVEIESKSESLTQLNKELVKYLKEVPQGTKISLEQLTIYFESTQDNLISVLSEIENNKDLTFKGTIKKEHVGVFFEIIVNNTMNSVVNEIESVLEKNFIKCYNCGNSFSVDQANQKCSKCNYENEKCTTCSKYTQFNDIKINCPHCHKSFHFSCFESKVKLFGRCSSCRELIDFDSIKRETVVHKKEQDNLSGSLSRLVDLKSKFVKKDKDDEEDNLFDF